MNDELMKKRLAKGENAMTVFIANWSDHKAIAEAISALHNGKGGTVFCGIDDQGRPVESAEPIVDEIEIDLRELITPSALFSVSDARVDGEEILVIDVTPGKTVPYVVDGRVWVRKGKRTEIASGTDVSHLVLERHKRTERWERETSIGMSEADLDVEEIHEFRREVRGHRKTEFDAKASDEEVLSKLGLLAPYGYTHAGDLLFAKDPAERHPQCRVQLVRFAADKLSDRYEDNRWYSGPLVSVFHKVLAAMEAANATESRFVKAGSKREDRSRYETAALREGLVNALAHRDYEPFSGGLRVSIYPSRIEIWNTGHFPKGLNPGNLNKEPVSTPTNPDITYAFYLRGYMERLGRGTQKIVQAAQELNAPVPEWRDEDGGVTLTIFAAGSAGDLDDRLNERQRAFLAAVPEGDTITAPEYQAAFAPDLSVKSATRDLRKLEKLGWLKRQGKARATEYLRIAP